MSPLQYMSSSPSSSSSPTPTRSSSAATPKWKEVPLWIPISAFVGTSMALAIPLLILRRQRNSLRHSLKDSGIAPPRRVTGVAVQLPRTSAATSMSSPAPLSPTKPSVFETIKDSMHGSDSPSLSSGLAQINASSAMLAGKAFAIATGLVAVSAYGVVVGVKTVLGVEDARQFGNKMRTMLFASRSLISRIRALESDDDEAEQHLSHSEKNTEGEAYEEWTWTDAEKRLERAYDEGGFLSWLQAAMREAEVEANVQREDTEKGVMELELEDRT